MSEQKTEGQEPQESTDIVVDSPEKESTDGDVRPLAKSERIRNYLIGIGAVSALILGLIGMFRGEPVAQKAWETARDALNKQALTLNHQQKTINRLKTRMVYFQAWQEASTAMAVQQKLEALQKKYDSLRSKGGVGTAGQPAAPKIVAKPTCSAGHLLGDDKKCHRVRRAIAARVEKDAQHAVLAARALEREKRKRFAAERERTKLMKSISKQSIDGVAPKMLRVLPAKLDDAAKKK